MTALASARTAMSGKLARVALATVAVGGALVAVDTTTSTPAGAAAYEAVTNDNKVSVRKCAKRSCDLVGTMAISGSVFYVYCWKSGESISGDKIWYNGAHPSIDYGGKGLRGYVAGYYLDTGHDPRKGVPKC